MQSSDVTIANLEGPMTFADWSDEAGKKEWQFRQLPVFAEGIKRSGIKVLLLANNHIADAGAQGIADTLEVLRKHGLRWVPPPQEGPLVLLEKGQRIELWNADIFSPAGSHPWACGEEELYAKIIAWRQSQPKPVLSVFVLHAHANAPSFMRKKEQLAIRLQQAGIDWIVFGGDHTPSSLETNNYGGIHFGLGDFVFGCECSGASEGRALRLNISTEGRVTAASIPLAIGTQQNAFATTLLEDQLQ
jgi:poly-gamma-glutamate synthesis protein (capsule biosynthesis protein)